MTISQLIKKLQEEKRKFGDIEVLIHAPTADTQPALDVFTASHSVGSKSSRVVWISSEEAE